MLQSVASTLAVGVVIGSLGYAFEFELRREWARRTQVAALDADQVKAKASQAGATFKECTADFSCPEMVVIPAGAFDMGSPPRRTGPLR